MNKSVTPSCPRCGYDQSGVMASFTHSCPLDGTCSECGLRFAWPDLVYADRLVAPGFYEHASGVAFRSAWRTWAWTLWPKVFWTRVRLEHPMRVPRAWLWLLVMLGAFQIVHAAFDGWMVWKWHVFLAAAPAGTRARLAPPSWSEGLIVHLLDPLLGSHERYPDYVPGRPVPAFSSRAWLDFLLTGWTPGWKDWPQYAAPTLAFSLALPLMLLILPHTRKVSKIRRSHLVRAFLFSQSWLIVFAAFRCFDQAWFAIIDLLVPPSSLGAWNGGSYGQAVLLPFLQNHPLWTGSVLAAWLSLWWWFAVGRGFRIERTRVVYLAMLLPSLLVFLIMALLFSRSLGTLIEDILTGKFRF